MVNIRNQSNHSNSRGMGRSPRAEGNKVYVSNIDFSCTHQDLKDAFKQVGEVAFVEMLKDNNQKPLGCAVIRFKQSNIADEAIRTMNRWELKGRKLVVKDERDAPKDKIHKERKRPRDDEHFDMYPTTSGEMFENTYGLSVQFLENLGIDGPLVNRVFVANLDYNVDEDLLREVFSIAGKVNDIELVRGDDGKSKGFGFIEFEHPIEAVQAISMLHNQMYRDRPMSVQLTRKEKKKKDSSIKLPPGLKSIGVGLGLNGAPLKDVKRTIEAGNQSLLGAMPTTQNVASFPMNNIGLGIGGMGLSSGFSGSRAGTSVSTDIAPGLRSTLTPSLTSDMSLPRGGGVGLMNMPSGLGLGVSSSLHSSMRGLSDTSMSGSANYGNFSGSSVSSQRNAIQISNLPNDFTWKSLQNLCMPFGDVVFAKITARGSGMVQFDNEAAARRASDMLDHQRYEGRYLETRQIYK